MALEYFTEGELRALPQMSDTSKYTSARIDAAAAYIVGIIERKVKTSFVERTVTNERHDGGSYGIVLNRAHVLSVTSATENGVSVTSTLRVRSGVVRKYASATSFQPQLWTPGVENVAVTYVSGYSAVPPADVKEAALKGTRWHLLATNSDSATNARQTALTNDQGGTIQFSVAGKNAPTGYPEVDAVIMGWAEQLATVSYP